MPSFQIARRTENYPRLVSVSVALVVGSLLLIKWLLIAIVAVIETLNLRLLGAIRGRHRWSS